jgi:tryptophan synthase alpha chain
VQKCIDFAKKVAETFDIPFLFMSYYNILYKYGIDRFVAAMARSDLHGAIVPDLPPEEGQDFLNAMQNERLAPIFIFSPTTPDERMKYLASFGKGFIYCVARKGVTGVDTDFSSQLEKYLARCRKATNLPLALGFGVKEKKDVEFLVGKVDIAVIGSQTIRLVDKEGVGVIGDFIKRLR